MNTSRKQAKANYEAALKNVRITENATDLAAWESANAVLATARTALIEAENNYPTMMEKKRENRKQWLRSIGIDA